MARKSYDYLFKVLLIGDSGVGKTCLIFRFCDDSFRQSFIATIGIDFKIKTVEMGGKRIRLQIWDTAGQERFHTITISYYRNAHAIFLVYDITRRESFENIVNWVRQVQQNAKENIELQLIGNKCDMEDARQITKERGRQLASDFGMPFIETSAKTGENVEKAYLDMVSILLRSSHSSSTATSGQTLKIERPLQDSSVDAQSRVISYSKCC